MFYIRYYTTVQYRTPITSHVPVKVNTVTCAGKGFVTPNKHDELPHSFYSTTDNNNHQQCTLYRIEDSILNRQYANLSALKISNVQYF